MLVFGSNFMTFYQSPIKILHHHVSLYASKSRKTSSLSVLVKKTSGSVGKIHRYFPKPHWVLLSGSDMNILVWKHWERTEIKGPCFTSLDFPFLFFPLVCVFLAAAAITAERAEWQNSSHAGINEPLLFHAFKWLCNDEKQRKSVPALCAKNVLYQNVCVRMSKFDITAEICYICISLPWATQTRSPIWPGESYCTILACSVLYKKSWCECVRFADCVWSLFNNACCRLLDRVFEQVLSV